MNRRGDRYPPPARCRWAPVPTYKLAPIAARQQAVRELLLPLRPIVEAACNIGLDRNQLPEAIDAAMTAAVLNGEADQLGRYLADELATRIERGRNA